MNQAIVETEHPYVCRLEISGVDCPDCALKIEKAIKRMPGVLDASMAFPEGRLNVALASTAPTNNDLAEKVRKLGYEVLVENKTDAKSGEDLKAGRWLHARKNPHLAAMVITAVFMAAGFISSWLNVAAPLPQAIFIIGIIAGIYHPARNGLMMLIYTREIDMNVLMSLAVAGAILIGEFEEALTVVFLFALGSFLQAYTLEKTRHTIKSLMDISPAQALVRKEGKDMFYPVEEISIGDLVLVRPGERIPVDGRVEDGSSHVNQSPVTGESLPVIKSRGDEVYAGSINSEGLLEVKAVKEFKDNTINRIISMVEEAQTNKAPYQQVVDRFAKYYTPAVIVVAVAVAVTPSLLFGAPFEKWFYQALGLLLVACPCALVISTPVSIVSALGSAASNGVLIKGGASLEKAGSLQAVTFDKTGTLTFGRPTVTEVMSFNGCSEASVLRIAGSLETYSEHPFARAIVSMARHTGIQVAKTSEFREVPGRGTTGRIAERNYNVGSQAFMQELEVDLTAAKSVMVDQKELGRTLVFVSCDRSLLGLLSMSDELRPESKRAIEDLKRSGIKKIAMLTGDHDATARLIAEKAGIDEVYSGLMPEDKLQAVKELMHKHGGTAMVGDGINDAPAMAASSLGIAMGAAGSDAALETADIALMADDLGKLAYVVRLSRRTITIIKQNIVLALLIKGLILLLVVPGYLTLWLAVAGDMGSSILVTLNGMRLMRRNIA